MSANGSSSRKRSIVWAIAGTAVAALVIPLLAAATSKSETQASAAPDFARNVAPIIRDKCAGCHRLGGIAPFAFRTEADVAQRAALVVAAIEGNRMPPWPPGPASPTYVGQGKRTLSAKQRSTLIRWARTQLATPGPVRSNRPIGAPKIATTSAQAGETLLDLRMPVAYRAAGKNGGTDDYRCFLLDPKLAEDAFVTSARIEPGQAKLVHHVILYRVLPESIADAKELDQSTPGEGWTCFGGSGIQQPVAGAGSGSFLENAGWISAWAPGWGGDRFPDGIGIAMPRGSQVVMQVHYNLLNGRDADRSRAVLTTVPGTRNLTPVQTMLMPAPVELACAKNEQSPLCDRTASQFDQIRTYGQEAALIPTGLLLLCKKNASNPQPNPVTFCDRGFKQPSTIHAIAGHMHLLGVSIKVELNPGTAGARTLLDIPRWDFHWQASYVLQQPVRVGPGDTVRVTCRHDATLRAKHQPNAKPRYVLWGEGTTDEMCLGVLQVTRG